MDHFKIHPNDLTALLEFNQKLLNLHHVVTPWSQKDLLCICPQILISVFAALTASIWS